MPDEYFMKKALDEAKAAFGRDEVPVGAVLVAANLCGLADRRAAIVLDGGELANEWDEAPGHVFMTGPATHVFDGEYDLRK